MSERCLQRWIQLYNDRGIDGITYKPRIGRPRVVPPESVRDEILPVVDKPQLAGENHWTAVKLYGFLRKEKDLEVRYPTLVSYLYEQDYACPIPRPMPEPPNREDWEDQREAFTNQLLEILEDENSRVFFRDEAGFEGDPRLGSVG